MPLERILPIALKAKPMALLIEGANPRHEHEWEIWASVKLPDDKVLVPGVISSNSNYVEHPELVSQRIIKYANLVGRERVMAGTDCGFGSRLPVPPCWPGPVSAVLLDEVARARRGRPASIRQAVGPGKKPKMREALAGEASPPRASMGGCRVRSCVQGTAVNLASVFHPRVHVPSHRQEIQAAGVCGADRPGARPHHARKRHRAAAHRARLHLFGPARDGQDHGGAHSGALSELHSRPDGDALRRVRELSRNRGRKFAGRDRDRRGVQSRHQRNARAARERALPAGARPLQGFHRRRSASDHQRSLQRAAEDAGGAARVGRVHPVHHRSAQDPDHHRVALPAVQLPVGRFRRSGEAHGGDLRARKGSRRIPRC